MAEKRIYSYEVMFLLSQSAATDFGGCISHINDLFHRAGADILAMQKWDERRLAYEIKKQRRGVYILAYITCANDRIHDLERDCVLSEKILRAQIIRADHLSADEMRAYDQRSDLEVEAKLRAERQKEAELAAMAAAGPGDDADEPEQN
jgi:small subunit ribosomal protein S6